MSESVKGEVMRVDPQVGSVELSVLPETVFTNIQTFENGQRMATVLSQSALVPKNFQGNLPNAVIALEMAQRLGASPLAVMQNMYIVHGKPSWSASFIIAAINSCGRFLPLRFEITGEGGDRTCVAWTKEINGDERLESPPVSIEMAKKEGWYGKNGSKWQTMPELMLRYRAATFFGRLYAPEILMGMRSTDEVVETPERFNEEGGSADVGVNERLGLAGDESVALKADVMEQEKPPPSKESSPSKEEEQAPDKGDERRATTAAAVQEDMDHRMNRTYASKNAAKQAPKNKRRSKAVQEKIDGFKKEILAKSTSLEIDQWAMKHQNRVTNAFPEDKEAADEVFLFAEATRKDLKAAKPE